MKTTTKSKFGRRISLANLIAQSGIIVTGAIVRLTGSGLGCPTWPDCAPGSLIPVAGQVEGFHKYIEFGNRTLTLLVHFHGLTLPEPGPGPAGDEPLLQRKLGLK